MIANAKMAMDSMAVYFLASSVLDDFQLLELLRSMFHGEIQEAFQGRPVSSSSGRIVAYSRFDYAIRCVRPSSYAPKALPSGLSRRTNELLGKLRVFPTFPLSIAPFEPYETVPL